MASRRDAEPHQVQDCQTFAQSGDASIAVLPFTKMSGDPEQAYLSDGISDDIITDLSKIADLTVIARNGHIGRQPFKRKKDVELIAEGLNKAGVRVC